MTIIHTTAEITIQAPPELVASLFRDFRLWPQIFPATILSVQLRRHDKSLVEVMVHHRYEGDVVNVLAFPARDVVELREFKQRFDAVFVNRFLASREGTRYVIEAEVRLKGAYSLLAAFAPRAIRRGLRRYTLEPMRISAEAPPEAFFRAMW